MQLRADVADVENSFAELRVSWAVDGVPVADPLAPNIEGEAFVTVDLDEGDRVISATVADTDGLRSTDELTVLVRPPNFLPACGVTEPDDGVGFALASPSLFRGFATDPDHANQDLAVTWTSDLDGVLGDDPPTADGEVQELIGGMSAGDHVVTLAVEDPALGRCWDAVFVSVSNRPEVTISAPLGGAIFEDDDPILLAGVATDPEDGNEYLSVDWSSEADGALGSTTTDPEGYAEVIATGLSVGDHVLRMQVTDLDGVGGSAEVSITIIPASR